MKKIITSFILGVVILMGFAQDANSQSVAIINIADILENMEDYKNAQAKLDKMAEQWQQEINAEFEEIEMMYNKYNAEQVLLSDAEKKEREETIINREKEVREKQKMRFGPEGELFSKRQQLVEPIQDKVYNAVQEYAELHNVDIILDKSSSAGLIFSNDEYDKTEDIKKMLDIR
ncbi:OmpH family outer membrane protein [Membranihabitans maritimus]|uniref:OmpH family outer membrane protein n=1 Tax=Membranihabitans maritimus TaxID=2904244 RepID=UPI001F336074|nr:OmpH family outer membrane protein [Membranihabitans maritimus]